MLIENVFNRSAVITALFFLILGVTLLGLWNIGISEKAPEPEPKPPLFTPEDLVSHAIWARHLKTFQKRLETRPEAARTELEKVGTKLFNGHLLVEEWVPLFYRLSREGTEHLTDIQRVSELEIRMLTALDAEKYGLQIEQHQHAMEELKAISAYGAFFEKLSPKALDALKNATEKNVEQLDQRYAESRKRTLELRKEHALEMVEHLRTLSLEEQREYLLKMLTRAANSPARKNLERKFPGSTKDLWNQKLQDLIDAGYTLPEGITFRE